MQRGLLEMHPVTVAKLLSKRLFSKRERDYAGYLLAAEVASSVYPKFAVSEYGKIWLEDKTFFDYYHKFVGKSYNSADRKFFLRSLLSLVDHLPGDTAECGAYYGASSWLICEHFRGADKTHHVFDSFEGLSAPSASDGGFWRQGDMKVGEDIVRERLAKYDVTIYKGWIPERFAEIINNRFCFVHVDVDLYQPSLDSLHFFYPRLICGGIILCDDYGFATCPGAKEAFDKYMADKPEEIIHAPTGQGFIVKQ